MEERDEGGIKHVLKPRLTRSHTHIVGVCVCVCAHQILQILKNLTNHNLIQNTVTAGIYRPLPGWLSTAHYITTTLARRDTPVTAHYLKLPRLISINLRYNTSSLTQGGGGGGGEIFILLEGGGGWRREIRQEQKWDKEMR